MKRRVQLRTPCLAAGLALTAAVTLAEGPYVGEHQQAPPSSVMASVGSYVETYAQQLAAVIADEDYTQLVSNPERNDLLPGAQPNAREAVRRRIHSEFALLRLPTDETTWTGVREVLEVDGRKVSDHAGRLTGLLQQPFLTAIDQWRALERESARFNIGDIQRDFNVPTFVLVFLRPDNQHRFVFDAPRRERTEVVIGYQEVAHPMFIQDGKGNDSPAQGFVRADPISGAIHATRLIVDSRDKAHAQIDVQFRNDPNLHLLVPVEMRERYWEPSGHVVEGVARYSKFKRFEVDTSWKIRP